MSHPEKLFQENSHQEIEQLICVCVRGNVLDSVLPLFDNLTFIYVIVLTMLNTLSIPDLSPS